MSPKTMISSKDRDKLIKCQNRWGSSLPGLHTLDPPLSPLLAHISGGRGNFLKHFLINVLILSGIS
jgi:hypothetical protein